jgi:hypothetical protein
MGRAHLTWAAMTWDTGCHVAVRLIPRASTDVASATQPTALACVLTASVILPGPRAERPTAPATAGDQPSSHRAQHRVSLQCPGLPRTGLCSPHVLPKSSAERECVTRGYEPSLTSVKQRL